VRKVLSSSESKIGSCALLRMKYLSDQYLRIRPRMLMRMNSGFNEEKKAVKHKVFITEEYLTSIKRSSPLNAN
jgi:hypothetical protein